MFTVQVRHVFEVGEHVGGLAGVLLGAELEYLEADGLVLGAEVLEVGVGQEEVIGGARVVAGALEQLASGREVFAAFYEADVVDPDERGRLHLAILQAAFVDLVTLGEISPILISEKKIIDCKQLSDVLCF